MEKLLKLLTYILGACCAICMLAWFFLLGTICSEPGAPIAATNHVIQYNCHGRIVYISTFQELLLHWLIPVTLVLALVCRAAYRRAEKQKEA